MNGLREEAPSQVKRAVILLWISLAVGVVETAITFSEMSDSGGEIWLLFGIGFLMYAFFIHHASERRKWARAGVLLFVILGLAGYFVPEWSSEQDRIAVAASIAMTFLEVVAVYWLFFGEGARWYSSQGVTQGAV